MGGGERPALEERGQLGRRETSVRGGESPALEERERPALEERDQRGRRRECSVMDLMNATSSLGAENVFGDMQFENISTAYFINFFLDKV